MRKASKNTTTSDTTANPHGERERAMARQAYNEALPYTDPRATYPRAQQYQQQVIEGVTRRGTR